MLARYLSYFSLEASSRERFYCFLTDILFNCQYYWRLWRWKLHAFPSFKKPPVMVLNLLVSELWTWLIFSWCWLWLRIMNIVVALLVFSKGWSLKTIFIVPVIMSDSPEHKGTLYHEPQKISAVNTKCSASYSWMVLNSV